MNPPIENKWTKYKSPAEIRFSRISAGFYNYSLNAVVKPFEAYFIASSTATLLPEITKVRGILCITCVFHWTVSIVF